MLKQQKVKRFVQKLQRSFIILYYYYGLAEHMFSLTASKEIINYLITFYIFIVCNKCVPLEIYSWSGFNSESDKYLFFSSLYIYYISCNQIKTWNSFQPIRSYYYKISKCVSDYYKKCVLS